VNQELFARQGCTENHNVIRWTLRIKVSKADSLRRMYRNQLVSVLTPASLPPGTPAS